MLRKQRQSSFSKLMQPAHARRLAAPTSPWQLLKWNLFITSAADFMPWSIKHKLPVQETAECWLLSKKVWKHQRLMKLRTYLQDQFQTGSTRQSNPSLRQCCEQCLQSWGSCQYLNSNPLSAFLKKWNKFIPFLIAILRFLRESEGTGGINHVWLCYIFIFLIYWPEPS